MFLKDNDSKKTKIWRKAGETKTMTTCRSFSKMSRKATRIQKKSFKMSTRRHQEIWRQKVQTRKNCQDKKPQKSVISLASFRKAQATKLRTYKKQDRSGLTPKALNELAEKVMKGSEMKLWFLKIESEAKSLKEIYNVGITIKWLKMELEKYDANDVFTIASKVIRDPRTDTLVPSRDAKKIDLCKRYNKVSLKTVVQNAQLYKETGQEWHLENSAPGEL